SDRNRSDPYDYSLDFPEYLNILGSLVFLKEVELNKKAIIFDMDGVLIDTEDHHKNIEHRIFRELEVPITEEERAPFIGMAADEMWKKVIDHFHLDKSADDLLDLNNQRILEYFIGMESLEPISGVTRILDWIRQNRIPLAVASSSS